MGKAISMMTRPVKTFNIENRAHKVISREKPMPAPLHESSKKQLEIARSINPTFMETQCKKDAELDERLKNIYVQSHDPKDDTQAQADPNRPLPVLTRTGPGFEYGFWEPKNIPEGKCTLKTALGFMSDHMEDPLKHTVDEIAAKNKLDPKDVENVLEYFRVFKVIVPEGKPHLAYTDRANIEAGEKKE